MTALLVNACVHTPPVESPDVIRSERAGLPHRLRDHCREVHLGRVQGAARVQPGGQEQVLDTSRHPGRLGGDPARGRTGGDAVHQLGVAGDGGERGAQFVGGVGEEAAHPFLAAAAFGERGLDLVDHAVEGGADLAGLRAGVGIGCGDPGECGGPVRSERRPGDLSRGGGDPAEQPGQDADAVGVEGGDAVGAESGDGAGVGPAVVGDAGEGGALGGAGVPAYDDGGGEDVAAGVEPGGEQSGRVASGDEEDQVGRAFGVARGPGQPVLGRVAHPSVQLAHQIRTLSEHSGEPEPGAHTDEGAGEEQQQGRDTAKGRTPGAGDAALNRCGLPLTCGSGCAARTA